MREGRPRKNRPLTNYRSAANLGSRCRPVSSCEGRVCEGRRSGSPGAVRYARHEAGVYCSLTYGRRFYEDEIRSVEGPDASGAAPKEPPLLSSGEKGLLRWRGHERRIVVVGFLPLTSVPNPNRRDPPGSFHDSTVWPSHRALQIKRGDGHVPV